MFHCFFLQKKYETIDAFPQISTLHFSGTPLPTQVPAFWGLSFKKPRKKMAKVNKTKKHEKNAFGTTIF